MNTSSQVSPKKAFLVSHSHWDRAWYQPFSQFRARLVYLIDRLIELLEKSESYKSFTLDGQTVLLEDYLQIRPANKQRLQTLIETGRLRIGPWYVLPDLFLVSGESVIRNIQLAHKIGKEFGKLDTVGYVPDPFGHFAQLPQVLRQFGIDTFVFMRGMPKSEAERLKNVFEWRAPDGSSVLSLYLREGYFNASALGQRFVIGRFDCVQADKEKALKQVKEAIAKLEQYQLEKVFLLLNGMDHMPEQAEIPELIRYINNEQNEVEVIHADLGQFFDALKAENTDNETFTGDLLGNAHHPILSSVWSTRSYLKQQNFKAQHMLERIIEPLFVVQQVLTQDKTDQEYLDHCWKELLKTHPHDNICGCSVDEVHRADETQFDYVHGLNEQMAISVLESLRLNGLEAPKQTGRYQQDIFVFNPHPFPVRESFQTTVFFENPEGEFGPSPEDFHLRAIDSNHSEIEIRVLSTQAQTLQANYINSVRGRSYAVEFELELPPLGYSIVHFFNDEKPVELHQAVLTQQISNKRFSLTWKNDELIFTDSKTGIERANFLGFESCRDLGDTYSFSPAKDDNPQQTFKARLIQADAVRKKMTVEYQLPVFLSAQTTERIITPITVEFSLQQDDHISAEISYINTASDVRIRCLLHSETQALFALSDAHFRLAKRGIIQPETPESNPDWYQAYPGEFEYPTQHQLDFSILADSQRACWIANEGLHEFELIQKQDVTWIAVTLHRSVGWLSVANGRIRRPQAGPQVATPEAQCHRRINAAIHFSYELGLHPKLVNMARKAARKPYCRYIPVMDNMPKTGSLPRHFSMLTWENELVQLSSFKPTERHGIFALRLVNLDQTTQTTSIHFGFNVTSYQFSDLYECWQPEFSKPIKNNILELSLSPHKIVTLLISTQS